MILTGITSGQVRVNFNETAMVDFCLGFSMVFLVYLLYQKTQADFVLNLSCFFFH